MMEKEKTEIDRAGQGIAEQGTKWYGSSIHDIILSLRFAHTVTQNTLRKICFVPHEILYCLQMKHRHAVLYTLQCTGKMLNENL